MSSNKLTPDEKASYVLFEDLKGQNYHWPMAAYGQVQHLCWEPQHILGTSKWSLVKAGIVAARADAELSVENCWKRQKGRQGKAITASKLEANEPVKPVSTEKGLAAETLRKKVLGDKLKRETSKKSGDILPLPMLHPCEAQRRIRVFKENMLNNEFDVLMSLLPDKTISNFVEMQGGSWNYFGNCHDVFLSVNRSGFIQPDGLLYNPQTKTLCALELKFGVTLEPMQVAKYCALFVLLKKMVMIDKNATFELIVLGDTGKMWKRASGEDGKKVGRFWAIDGKSVAEDIKTLQKDQQDTIAEKKRDAEAKGTKADDEVDDYTKLQNQLGDDVAERDVPQDVAVSDMEDVLSDLTVRFLPWHGFATFLEDELETGSLKGEKKDNEIAKKLVDGFVWGLKQRELVARNCCKLPKAQNT